MSKVAATKTTGSKQNFAQNLRVECSKFRSIAHVCRALELNRQQFNRYLSGQHLPRPQTRRRICELFGVPEPEMFMAPAERETLDSQLTSPWPIWPPTLFQEVAKLSVPENQGSEVSDGFYFLYFSLKMDRRMLVRSILKIRTSAGVRLAVWHTLFRSDMFPAKYLKQGRYNGVIITGNDELTLLTTNSKRPSALGLVKLRQNGSVYSGAGFVHGVTETYLSRVCLEFLGPRLSDVRTNFKRVGVVSASDLTVSSAARAELDKAL